MMLRMGRTVFLVCVFAMGCKGRDISTVGPSAQPPASVASSSSVVDAAPSDASKSRQSGQQTFDFDGDEANKPPSAFTALRKGGNRDGKWVVLKESDAISKPNVVAQMDTDPSDTRFSLLLTNELQSANTTQSVRCKPVSGIVDQACGMVCRVNEDASNYYLARANALENNVRLYVVQNGVRKELASWSGAVKTGQWHRLALVCHDSLFSVDWDETRVISKVDKTYANRGKVGLWVKADSVTYFDDFEIKDAANP